MNQPASILIIDDDRGTCETVGDVLRAKGYAVETATRGREGLDKLSARPFDAGIVDIKLPDISGLDLLEAARAPVGPPGAQPGLKPARGPGAVPSAPGALRPLRARS